MGGRFTHLNPVAGVTLFEKHRDEITSALEEIRRDVFDSAGDIEEEIVYKDLVLYSDPPPLRNPAISFVTETCSIVIGTYTSNMLYIVGSLHQRSLGSFFVPTKLDKALEIIINWINSKM